MTASRSCQFNCAPWKGLPQVNWRSIPADGVSVFTLLGSTARAFLNIALRRAFASLSIVFFGAGLSLPLIAVADTVPVITQQPISTIATVGTQVNLTVIVSGATFNTYSYQWFKDGGPLYAQEGAELSLPGQPDDAGTYAVNVTDLAGSTMSSTATVAVDTPFLPQSRVPGGLSQTVDVGSPVTLLSSFNYINGQPFVIEWFKDGNLIPGANSTQLTLASPQLSDAGSYVEVDCFLEGSISQLPQALEVVKPYNPYKWVDSCEQGGIAYFLFSNPAQVLRYDMNAGSWLAPVSLSQTSAPSAMEALPEGVYISFGASNFLYSLDLSSATPLPNSSINTYHIFSNPSFVYLVGESNEGNAVFTSVNRSTGEIANFSDSGLEDLWGVEASNSSGLAYGWIAGSPASLATFTLDAFGSVLNYSGTSLGRVDIPEYSHQNLVVTPDGSQIVAPDGTVYSSTTLDLVASTGGFPIDDMSFLSDGKAVALRADKLTLYGSGNYAEIGSISVPGGAERVLGLGSNAFAFTAPLTQGGSITVATIPEAQLAAGAPVPLPGLSASDSAAVTTAPDDAFIGTDGIVYLLSRPTGNILRWSPSGNSYLASLPLMAIPIGFSYSSTLNRVYISYPDNRITQIDLATTTSESPFAATDGTPVSLLAAGNQVYVITDVSGATNRYLFNSGGSFTADQSEFETDYLPFWNNALGEIFDIPQSLESFSIAGGAFGNAVNLSSNLDPLPLDPLRFSPNGTLLISGNGVIYNSSSFAVTGILAVSPVDATWVGSTVFSVVASVSGTELDEWKSPGYLLSAKTQLAGRPLRLWALSGGGLLALTEQPSGPVFTRLDNSGNFLGQYANSGVPILPPEVTVGPLNTTVLPGGTVTLDVTALGTDLTYSWFNYSLGSVGFGPSLVISNATEAQAGLYIVTVTGVGGTSATASVSVAVSIPPVITTQPTDLSLAIGAAGTLSVSSTSFPAARYQWYLNGSPVPQETLSTINVGSGLGFPGAGTYTVTATNPFGTVTSNHAVVTIGQPVQITSQPVSQTVLAGGSVNLSVTATGNPSPTYQWYVNGTAISGATSNTLSLSTVPVSAAGPYSVTVSNENGVVPSNTATLTVTGAPFDINGDGMPDVFWTNTSTHDRGTYLMNGTSVTGWADFGNVPAHWRIGAVADFTGNGNDDILWQNTATGECGFYMMHGTVVTGWVELGVVPTQWRIAGAADFTGTGNTDILWQNTTTGECGIYMMNGTTVTGWVSLGTVSTQWRMVGAGDFSGNGSRDILWENSTTGVCGFYLMSGTTVTGWSPLGTVSPVWRAAEVADFSGYGHPDIIWQNTSTGACGFYMMNGLTVTGWAGLGTPPAGWQIMP
jgi:hypothetical protein